MTDSFQLLTMFSLPLEMLKRPATQQTKRDHTERGESKIVCVKKDVVVRPPGFEPGITDLEGLHPYLTVS